MPVKYLDSVYYAAIKVKAANIYVSDTFVPVCISEANVAAAATGAYRADGADVVVTTEAGVLVPREIASFNRAGGTFQIWFRDPAQNSATGGTQLYLQWGGASVNVADDATVWSGNYGGSINHALVVHGEESGANLIDSSGNYTAADTSITYNQPGKVKQAPTFVNASNSRSSWGNVTQLNSVQKFTLSFWMNQNVLDTYNIIFQKEVDANNRVRITTFTDGFFYFVVNNGSGTYQRFDYSTVITAGVFAHVVVVYDGTQAVVANRLKVYVNSANQSLALSGTIPTSTANLAAASARIGETANSFDGEIDELRLNTGALSLNQIKGQYDNQNGFATNATITIGAVTVFSSLVTQQSHIANYIGNAIM